MKPRRAAHLLAVGFTGGCCFLSALPSIVPTLCVSVPVTNCAIFLPNLSLSMCANFSFRFRAPGRLFRLLWVNFPGSFFEPNPLSSSPSTSPRLSRVVTNFLFGRRRFRGFAWAFSIRFTKAECLIVLLSFLLLMKPSSMTAPSRCDCGKRPDLDREALVRIAGRDFGAVGAYPISLYQGRMI